MRNETPGRKRQSFKSRLVLSLCALTLVTVSGCTTHYQKGTELDLEEVPRGFYANDATSGVTVTAKILYSNLEAILNRAFDERFQDNSPVSLTNLISGESLSYNISRHPVELSENNGRLHFKIPLSGSARIRGNIALVPFSATANDLIGHISGNIEATLSNQWRVSITTTPTLYLNNASIHVLGNNISVRSLLERKLNPRIQEYVAGAVLEIQNSDELKTSMSNVWDDLHISKKISDDENLYLLMTPKRVSATAPRSARDGLEITANYNANFQLVLNDFVERPEVTTLPNLTVLTSPPEEGFLIQLPVMLSAYELSLELTNKLRDCEIEISAEKVIFIDRVDIKGNRDQLNIEINFSTYKGWMFWNNTKGKIFLKGEPDYRSETYDLSIRGLEFDYSVDSMTLEGMKWVLRPIIIKKLSEMLRINVQSHAKMLIDKANAQIKKIKKEMNVETETSLNSINITDVKIKNGWIYLLIQATGDTGMTVVEIPSQERQ